MQSALLLDVVVGESAAVLQLLAREDDALLLVGGDAFLFLDQGFGDVDDVGDIDLKSNALVMVFPVRELMNRCKPPCAGDARQQTNKTKQQSLPKQYRRQQAAGSKRTQAEAAGSKSMQAEVGGRGRELAVACGHRSESSEADKMRPVFSSKFHA